jgi:hypothetical protein
LTIGNSAPIGKKTNKNNLIDKVDKMPFEIVEAVEDSDNDRHSRVSVSTNSDAVTRDINIGISMKRKCLSLKKSEGRRLKKFQKKVTKPSRVF